MSHNSKRLWPGIRLLYEEKSKSISSATDIEIINPAFIDLHRNAAVSWVPGECANATTFSKEAFKLLHSIKVTSAVGPDGMFHCF